MFPPFSVEDIDAELGEEVGEVDIDPIIGDSFVFDVPDVHEFDDDAFEGGFDSHKFAGVQGVDIAESRDPFSLGELGFGDIFSVGESFSEGELPSCTKVSEILFFSASVIAFPLKGFVEVFCHIVVIIFEGFTHFGDDVHTFLGFGEVIIEGEVREGLGFHSRSPESVSKKWDASFLKATWTISPALTRKFLLHLTARY